jgi:hypothetical protein
VEDVVSPEWGFFVDESGKLQKPDESVVGTGILLRLDEPTVSLKAIERELYKVMPDFPWPLPAPHINLSVTAIAARGARLRGRWSAPRPPRSSSSASGGCASARSPSLSRFSS